MTDTLAVIFGCASTSLTQEEKDFYKKINPLGFILFARNCESPDQVRALVREMRACVGREDAPVLIDQEGGQVQRLKPPQWRDTPKPALFSALHDIDPIAGFDAAKINARIIAADLFDLGIDVNCLPCLDIPQPDSHDFLRNRASGKTPEQSIALGWAVIEGLMIGGIMPVIKHMPGHGRATVDSHHELPRIAASLEELHNIDFKPFRKLKEIGWGMTCHVIYESIDPDYTASTSDMIINMVIRENIGFDGFLVSDDIGMNALGGSVSDRTIACLDAGTDAILHCNGDMDEMIQVAGTGRLLNETSLARFKRGRDMLMEPIPFDRQAAEESLAALLAKLPESV